MQKKRLVNFTYALSMIKNSLSTLFHPDPVSLIVAGLQALFFLFNIIRKLLKPGMRRFDLQLDLPGMGIIVLSCLATYLLSRLLWLLFRRRRSALVISGLLLIILYFLLIGYQLKTDSELDCRIISDYSSELFYQESLGVLFSSVGTPLWVLLFIIPGLIFLEIRSKILSRERSGIRHPLPALIIGSSAFVLIILANIPLYDPITHLLQSAIHNPLDRLSPACTAALPSYPYVHQEKTTAAAIGPDSRPHVFIVLVESLSKHFVSNRDSQDREYMPFLNSRLTQGLFFDKFYSTAVNTSSGLQAVLCSILPALRGKISTHYPLLRLKSLAHIVRENGYQTVFMNAAFSNGFEHTGEFVKRIGFDFVLAMEEGFIAKTDRPYAWGWGLQDEIFFPKVFDFLEKQKSLLPANSVSRPIFCVLSTIASHMRWNQIPRHEQYLFPDPASPFERFANAIHLADRGLREFFRQLQNRPGFANSLVIICGDHGFPAGEHGNFFSEIGCYEESFRTPLLIWWPGHVTPHIDAERICSQLDIAPTILDLLGISATTPFMGQSLLRKPLRADPIVPLFQPYDGIFLSTLQYPRKYVWHLRTGREFLYDLEADPLESINILDDFHHSQQLLELRKACNIFFINQYLLDNNRIWPGPAIK